LNINDELMDRVKASAERIWPGQGIRAITRLTRDAIKRYLRYCDGGTGHRTG
jgi:Xaa-Pro aminopeptidase